MKNRKICDFRKFGKSTFFRFSKNLKFDQNFRFFKISTMFFKKCIHPTLKSRNFCTIGPILIIFDFLPNSLICIFPQSYLFSGKVPRKFLKSWIRFSRFCSGSDFARFWRYLDSENEGEIQNIDFGHVSTNLGSF